MRHDIGLEGEKRDLPINEKEGKGKKESLIVERVYGVLDTNMQKKSNTPTREKSNKRGGEPRNRKKRESTHNCALTGNREERRGGK